MLAFVTVAILASIPAQSATLIIRAEGVTSSEGMVYAGICDTSFEEATCPYKDRAPAKPGTVEMRVRNVKPGSYAVAVFHDTTQNGKLDRDFIGLPSEPYGFSNDQARRGPPSFKGAVIDVRDPVTTIVVQIR
jgi:uncharacterized protein (DUF2141 family)